MSVHGYRDHKSIYSLKNNIQIPVNSLFKNPKIKYNYLMKIHSIKSLILNIKFFIRNHRNHRNYMYSTRLNGIQSTGTYS